MIKYESQHKATVLIAEDEDISYLYLSSILKKEPFKVLRAINGQEAVDLCKAHYDINIVLMDINMPVMDGFEATTLIKSFRQDLPVIAVTAYALDNNEHKAYQAGCNDYLAKPVRRELLLSTLQKYL